MACYNCRQQLNGQNIMATMLSPGDFQGFAPQNYKIDIADPALNAMKGYGYMQGVQDKSEESKAISAQRNALAKQQEFETQSAQQQQADLADVYDLLQNGRAVTRTSLGQSYDADKNQYAANTGSQMDVAGLEQYSAGNAPESASGFASNKQSMTQAIPMQEQEGRQALSASEKVQLLGNLTIKHPALAEHAKTVYDNMDAQAKQYNLQQLGQIHAALLNGATAEAQDIVNQRLELARRSGNVDEERAMQSLSDQIRTDPTNATLSTAATLSGALGAQNYANNFSALATSNAARDKAAAEANTAVTKAQYEPYNQESRLQKERADTQYRGAETQGKLGGAGGVGMDKDTIKNVNDLALVNSGLDAQIAKLKEITDKSNEFERGGVLNKVGAAAVGGLFGYADTDTQLRKQTQSVTDAIAAANLPKGSASDADREFALRSMPDIATASPAQLKAYIARLERVARLARDYNDGIMRWATLHGNLAPADGVSANEYAEDYAQRKNPKTGK
jgi:hypothetical protein